MKEKNREYHYDNECKKGDKKIKFKFISNKKNRELKY